MQHPSVKTSSVVHTRNNLFESTQLLLVAWLMRTCRRQMFFMFFFLPFCVHHMVHVCLHRDRCPAENLSLDDLHPERCKCRVQRPGNDLPSSCTTTRTRRRLHLPCLPKAARCRSLRSDFRSFCRNPTRFFFLEASRFLFTSCSSVDIMSTAV